MENILIVRTSLAGAFKAEPLWVKRSLGRPTGLSVR
jgi:hypothetical protein